ncbi:universal stress protein [Haloarchaeobius amylolyticus]|uniref:universal stress protein n=1 Tax=Haloarchaeobius amylolyticus TaxID=1198296 RepID=UPI00226DAE7C|nr:universal stress protein [Haloarchaeobius amylolyticus]
MESDLLSHPVVPVAGEKDAHATLDALLPYLTEESRLTIVHVVEKAGGAPDKASVEQREEYAQEAFDAAAEHCEEAGIEYETRLAYGRNVSKAIFDAATEVDATAVAFVPRKGSRLLRFITGDTTLDLVTEAELPVIALPGGDG